MEEMIIKKPSDLINLLLSLKEAKGEKYADDPRQVYFSQSKRRDQEVFDLEEEDEAPAEEEAPEEEPAPTEKAPTQQVAPQAPVTAPKDKKPAAPAAAQSATPSDLNPSLDGIIRSINQLRGGKSTKDARDELSVYYDRLDDATRDALYTFIKSLSGILTDQMTGATAIDPEDPPMNISISVAPGQEEDEDEDESSPEPNAEDTTPPIVAGQQQVKESVKRRLSQLMRR